ncbi:MAG: mannose-1-phosphate guanylyltransferase/mannose-6-phosphate isomerase [Granulosicoccus sp.]
MTTIVPVILAGGSGTRLWPLSRADYPKQFLALGGEQTLLQETALRLHGTAAQPPLVVCSEQHRFLTAEQLQQAGINDADIMLEPAARNTTPAIAVAAWHAILRDPESLLLVMPADHLIPDVEAFRLLLEPAAIEAGNGHLVTLGIAPTHPETGYGYIEAGAEIASSGSGETTPALKVNRFIEKPDAVTAARLIDAGNCYWNAGIFVFTAQVFLDALQSLKPEMHELTRKAVEGATTDLDFIRLDVEPFAACEDISVDYAVMEQSSNTVVLPFNTAWSDIGSWDAIHQVGAKDDRNNSAVGDVIFDDCSDCHVHASSRLVTILGLKNVSVIETPDAVLVLDMANAQGIKRIIEQLKKDDREELTTHQTCYRPWGNYTSLSRADRYQVKRIVVKPLATLSLQKHFHRAEHWVVVKGTAVVTIGEEEIMLTENESTYIPLGAVHRMHNPGSIPLELIEVQSGSYLGEDDIVRIGDEYGRS